MNVTWFVVAICLGVYVTLLSITLRTSFGIMTFDGIIWIILFDYIFEGGNDGGGWTNTTLLVDNRLYCLRYTGFVIVVVVVDDGGGTIICNVLDLGTAVGDNTVLCIGAPLFITIGLNCKLLAGR